MKIILNPLSGVLFLLHSLYCFVVGFFVSEATHTHTKWLGNSVSDKDL